MTNPVPTHAPKTDTPATQIPEDLIAMYERLQKFRLGGLACILTSMDAIELIERVASLESTLAAERASRDQIIQLHNDAAVEAIQRSQEYMSKYDKLVAEGWDVLKTERAARLQAEEALRKAEEALLSGNQMDGMGERYAIDAAPLIEALTSIRAYFRALSKPSVSPEQEKPSGPA